MASKEFNRPDWSKPYTEKPSHKHRQEESDPLFDRDWEVFVIRRDTETGAFATQIACCEEIVENCMTASLPRRLVAEFVGTAFLLIAIIGSGIMAERLSGGNAALSLLGNSLAVGTALISLIYTFGAVSGAHFNPAVTLADCIQGRFLWKEFPGYFAAQIAGAFFGVGLANLMFDLPAFYPSEKARSGSSQLLSEFVATAGLIIVIYGTLRWGKRAVTLAVAAYITSAIWFTSSTSFANPAVSIARSMSNTYAGIRPADVPAFVIVELVAAIAAVVLVRWLFSNEE